MNPEVKEKWVTALRSGDYEQGRGRLETLPFSEGEPSEFCCLGVLCDLAVKEGVAVRTAGTDTVSYRGKGDTYGSNSYVPPAIQKWAGLNRRNPFVPLEKDGKPYAGGTLALANDDLHWDFNQIADLIERCL